MSQPHYKKIIEAAELLGIRTPATQKQIKQKYRDLMKKWHPDKCSEAPAKCREMTEKLISAYELIVEYIADYKFSFEEDDVKNNLPVDRDSWWAEMYGEDPLWGRRKDK